MKSELQLIATQPKTPGAKLWAKLSVSLRKRYRSVTILVQVVMDFFTVLLGNALAYELYLALGVGKHHIDPSLYWNLNLLVSLGAVLVFSVTGVYSETVGMVNIEETRRLIKAVFYVAITVLVGSFFVREYTYSRITTVLAVPVNLLLLHVQRLATSYIHSALHRHGVGVRRCLIYGAGEIGISVARRFFQNRQLGWMPVGFLVQEPSRLGESHRVTPGPEGLHLKVLGGLDNLDAVARDHQATDLVVTATADPKEQVVEAATMQCQRLGIHCHFILVDAQHLSHSYTLWDLDGIPLFSPKEIRTGPYDLLKRMFDVCVASFLLILLSPIFLLIALVIKLDSPGPVLFRQQRVGLGGREFTIYKFRTLHVHTDPYALTPSSTEDQRITRVGKVLRRTSLDELPQLLNVLKGDMSLVGPRPEMPFLVATYNEYQRQRLAVRPGITGLWQISGDRAFKIHENIEYDLYYIANRSFLLDLAILFQTVFSVVRGVGAW